MDKQVTQSHRYILLGAGGHAKVITDMLHRAGHHLVGLVDNGTERKEIEGVGFMFQDDFLAHLEETGQLPFEAHGIILSIGHNGARARLNEMLGQFIGPAIIDPSAQIGPDSTIGKGTVIMPGARVGANVMVGDNCIINTGATVCDGVEMAPCVHTAPRTFLEANVHIGSVTLIGARSVVKQGVIIGEHVTVGAGSIVDRNIEPSQKWIQKN